MRINNNITAMNTHRQYTVNNNNISKSAEKLSSGYRVNRAGDDAAGLAISEKMRAQIRGLNMASKNSQDGNSLIQTAEGALQEVHSILQRMNELAVQSATGTNQNLDRNALDQEFQQLIAEIDDISQQTTFNDMQLLNGDYKVQYQFLAGAGGIRETGNIAFTIGADTYTAAINKVVDANVKNNTDTYQITAVNGTKMTLRVAESATVFKDYEIDLKDVIEGVDITETGILLKEDESCFLDLTSYGLGSYELTAAASGLTGAAIIGIVTDGTAGMLGEFIGTARSATRANPVDNPLSIQVGAKEGNLMDIGIDEVSSAVLGLTGRNIASQDAAGRAVSIVRSAANQVSTVRSALGAAQNRLEHKIANLDNQAENLQAAESRIRDVDMASEMTNFTKNSILSQAATAMLAQANALPQNVLQLLR